MGNRKILAAAVAVITALSAGCSRTSTGSNDKNTRVSKITTIASTIEAEDIEIGYNESDSVSIAFGENNVTCDSENVTVDGTKVTIKAAGTYLLSGSCPNGQVIVSADTQAQVKLVLNGLDLTCKNNSALIVDAADKTFLLLEKGTDNKLTDGAEYDTAEGENQDSAIFSRSDLTINGEGSLTVTGNYKHGVVSKDDLVITGGNITVTSASSALVGKDSVKISNGSFDLSGGTDAIKSDNSQEEDKGYVSISGGTFKIVANGDGISAETGLTVSGGDFDMTTGGGSTNASVKSNGSPNGEWRNDMQNGEGGRRGGFGGDMGDMGGMQPPADMGTPPHGEMPENAVNTQSLEVTQADNETEDSDTSTSAKGLKSGGDLVITGGTFKIDSADDSIHVDGSCQISGGTFDMSSGDDGIHVGGDLVISDGDLTISKSYEGIEGMTVTLSGGSINVTADDDGINCAGGSDTGNADRMGRDQFAAQEGVFLRITGGTVNIDSYGDGLDSNGELYIEGGTIYVSGPTNGGNGSIDHNGSASITGGTIIACGAVGMEEMFEEEGTTQYAVLHDFTQSFPENTQLTVTDSDGNVILSFTNPKTWQGVIFSSPELKEGETYTVSAGDESEEITLSSYITSNSIGGMGGFGGRGF